MKELINTDYIEKFIEFITTHTQEFKDSCVKILSTDDCAYWICLTVDDDLYRVIIITEEGQELSSWDNLSIEDVEVALYEAIEAIEEIESKENMVSIDDIEANLICVLNDAGIPDDLQEFLINDFIENLRSYGVALY